MVQLKNLCDDLTIRGRHGTCRDTATLQLGVCFRNHQIQTRRLDQGKTLRAQLGCKQSERLRRGHRHIAGQGDGAFHARIDHHIVARQRGQGFGHRVNLGIDEVQCDGLRRLFGRRVARSGAGFFVGLWGLCCGMNGP